MKINLRCIKLILALYNFLCIWMFSLHELTSQLVHDSHLRCCGIHLMLETVETVFHDGQLFNIISYYDGSQEFLLQMESIIHLLF